MGRAEPPTGDARVMRGRGRRGEKGGSRAAVGGGEPGTAAATRAFWAVLDPRPHNSCHLQEPRLDVKRMPRCLPADSVGTMASLMPLSPYLSPTVLLLVSCDLGFVRAGE